jgi:acetoin utilization deacetylase AcuC-like enzyme
MFYDARQSIEDVNSFSRSAAKPARFVALLQHYNYTDYGPHHRGPVIPVTKEDLYRVHSKGYIDDVFSGVQNNGFETRDPRVPEACLWTSGSLLASARQALKYPENPQCSPTSGFHHAGHSWGGGYCTFNGLMVTAAKLLSENPALKIGILDCDMHYGDGTDDILKRHPELAKSIIHRTQGKHFHGDDPETEALEFEFWLDYSIKELNEFGCDLVLYQAGADPHIKDPLGGFLTSEQLASRDAAVFNGINCAIAWCLAGGYQEQTDDHLTSDPVLQVHYRTERESCKSYKLRLAKFKG